MGSTKKERAAKGFTCSKSEVIKHLRQLSKDFNSQGEYKDVIKFIADKMDEMGYLDKTIDKYKLINSFIIQNNELTGARTAADDKRVEDFLHPRNRNYDYGKPTDELE